MIEYTYEDVVQVLKNIVHARGEDYVYEKVNGNCVYFDTENQQPSCLVGHFMYETGILTLEEDFADYEEEDADNLVYQLDRRGIAYFDERSQNLLSWVQFKQDMGNTWGDSLSDGIDAVSHL
jgi:hypothetical protein